MWGLPSPWSEEVRIHQHELLLDDEALLEHGNDRDITIRADLRYGIDDAVDGNAFDLDRFQRQHLLEDALLGVDGGLHDDPAARHLPLGDPGLLLDDRDHERVGLVGLTHLDTPGGGLAHGLIPFTRSRRAGACVAAKRGSACFQ